MYQGHLIHGQIHCNVITLMYSILWPLRQVQVVCPTPIHVPSAVVEGLSHMHSWISLSWPKWFDSIPTQLLALSTGHTYGTGERRYLQFCVAGAIAPLPTSESILCRCVAVDPRVAQVNIKAFKTDPFCKGVSVFLGRTSSVLCPVLVLAAYLASRGPQLGPFFLIEGRPLTREVFVSKDRKALLEAGFDPLKFAGHIFRIGAASTTASWAVEDSLIKTLGRWLSSAYLLYIRIP